MSVRWLSGGIVAPRCFAAAATRAGLRSAPGDDLALVVSELGPVPAAATFTTNRFRAAPVLLAQRSLRASRGCCAAIIANAGCANAGTGPD